MEERIVQTAGRDALGKFAPAFAHYNDDVLFGENWNDPAIDVKTRSIITVTALMAQGITDSSLKYHIMNAKNHGVTKEEMAGIITHVAFYAGWPKAWAVFNLAKEVYSDAEAEASEKDRYRNSIACPSCGSGRRPDADLRGRQRLVSGMGQGCCGNETRNSDQYPCRGETLAWRGC